MKGLELILIPLAALFAWSALGASVSGKGNYRETKAYMAGANKCDIGGTPIFYKIERGQLNEICKKK